MIATRILLPLTAGQAHFYFTRMAEHANDPSSGYCLMCAEPNCLAHREAKASLFFANLGSDDPIAERRQS